MKLLSAIRKATGHIREFEDAVKDIKLAKVNILAVDKFVSDLPFKKINNELHINNLPLREAEKFFRNGKLIELGEKLKIPHNISVADEIGYKKLLNDIPDVNISEFTDKVNLKKLQHSDLDLKPPKTGKELEQVLTPEAKSKVKNAVTKLSQVSAGSVITGALFAGAIVLAGKDIYETLAKAAESRNGCYLVKKINNKIISCKIPNHSCNVNLGTKLCNTDEVAKIEENGYILMAYAIENSNSEIANKLKQHLNVTELNLNQVQANIDKIIEFYNDNLDTILGKIQNLCKYRTDKKLPCIACDPNADLYSPNYINIKNLPDNFTVQCVKDSTILDTLLDYAEGAGVNILDTFSTKFTKLLKPIGIIFGIILGLYVVFQIFMFFRRRQQQQQ